MFNKCVLCDKPFTKKHNARKYCSEECREEANRIKARARYHNNREECLKYEKWYREGGRHLIKQKRGTLDNTKKFTDLGIGEECAVSIIDLFKNHRISVNFVARERTVGGYARYDFMPFDSKEQGFSADYIGEVFFNDIRWNCYKRLAPATREDVLK